MKSSEQLVMSQVDVNATLTVALLARVFPYSSWVQQPMRATAILDAHPNTHWTGQLDPDQDRAGSLHPDGASL